MTRRRLLWAGVVLLAVAAFGVAVVLSLLPDDDRTGQVGRLAFSRLREGMTQQEVEAILGAPGSIASGSRTGAVVTGWVGRKNDKDVTFKEWQLGPTWIIIGFDPDGLACSGTILSPDPSESWHQRIRRSLSR